MPHFYTPEDNAREELDAEFNARFDDVAERFAGSAIDGRREMLMDLEWLKEEAAQEEAAQEEAAQEEAARGGDVK